MKYKDVPKTAIKLMLFPFSIDGLARIWLEKEPPRSIETWDDLVSKFINKFFPPSKTTNLRNEISNFQQRFDEPFHETWDRFKDLLRACPHHDFIELHQLDTFYNSLNPTDQDSFNSAAGGNLLERSTKDALTIIKNKSKVQNSRSRPVFAKVSTSTSTLGISPDVAALTDAVKALLLKNMSPPLAFVKVVEESCVTSAVNYNQGNAGHRPPSVAHQVRPPGFPPIHNNQNRGNNYNLGNSTYRAPTPPTALLNKLANYMKVNETSMRAMQNQINNVKTELRNEFQATMLQQNNKLENMLSNYFQMNKPSGSGSGPLPSNTVNNPKGGGKRARGNKGSGAIKYQKSPTSGCPTSESVDTRKPKPNIPYPSRLNNQKLRERDDHQMKKFLQIFQSVHFNLSFSDTLLYMPKFASTFKNLLNNKEKLFKVANTPVNENCSAVILKKLPEKLGDPGKFLIPCNFPEIAECLALADLGKFHFPADFVVVDYDVDPRTPLILERPFLRTARALIDVYGEELTLQVGDEALTFKVGDIHLLEKFLNEDPSSPLLSKEIKTKELKSVKSSVDEPLELELKDLPSHLEYAFLEGTDKLPVIIAKDLKDDEKERLIKVLKSHKHAISWKLSDIKGIEPQFCTYKILMEDDFKPAVQHQRRVNPKIHEVIKKEVIKLLDAGLIYPIFDSPWVSLVHCVPKKGGMTFATNENNELIPTRYFQIPIDPQDQEKTTFTCPYGTFAYRRMPFGLCNPPGIFQRGFLLILPLSFRQNAPKTIVYTDHSALKYLLAKQDAKLRLLRWILLLQEFDVEISDKKGADNLAPDHLSRLENPQSNLEKKEITKTFPLETLGMVTFRGDSNTPWFANIANYHADGVYTAKKPLISSRLATMDPPGDIMVPTTPLRKSSISASIGLRFIEMPMTWSHGVTLVATILQISSAIRHISNIDNMYIKSYSFSLFSSLPGVLTPVRGESLKILNGFDVSLPVSHSLWSSQSFGHQKAINGFDMPLPVAVCSGLVNPLAPRKGKFHGGLITMSTLCT
ncbi:reverse transcriptase domain-containing protein [Tanacetum coccineum]